MGNSGENLGSNILIYLFQIYLKLSRKHTSDVEVTRTPCGSFDVFLI